jgi:hypothetical protein
VVLVAAIAIIGTRYALTSSPEDERPVSLPPSFAGANLNTGPASFATDPSWISTVKDSIGDVPFAGAGYGEPGNPTAVVNVIAARTDLTGKLDQRMAGDAGELLGATRCTRRVMIEPPGDDQKPTEIDTWLLCWRTSELLSVTALAMLRPPPPEELAAAVDATWQSLR